MRIEVSERIEKAFSIKSTHGYEEALRILEEAHIFSQRYYKEHFYVHWKMLLLAWEFKNWKEFTGQIPRLILAIPGSLTGKAPKGNLGSTKMGIFEKRN